MTVTSSVVAMRPVLTYPSEWEMRVSTSSTHFIFSTPDLSKPELEFVRDDSREPVLVVNLGGYSGMTPLSGLMKHLSIPEAHEDRKLLTLVPKSLSCTRSVKFGDPIPSELLTGAPSWSPDAKTIQVMASRFIQMLVGAEKPVKAVAIPDTQPVTSDRIAQGLLSSLSASQISRIRGFMDDPKADIEPCLMAAVVELGRVEKLRQSTTIVQRTVGELAKHSAGNSSNTSGEITRRIAMLLRGAAIWGTKQAMVLDSTAGNPQGLLSTGDYVADQIWPRIRSLRALTLDVEPLIRQWMKLKQTGDVPELRELEKMLRLATLRFRNFVPDVYVVGPDSGDNGVFDFA